ncbi:hypothetical protein ACFPM7_07460 [Actinokineospora guangxiensis]|uniref:Uncharacterized protein n=1 Tax=Actinokineospora guangxiensis TaxID=1490288 RepID=A0ABW0EKT1_9PSEU
MTQPPHNKPPHGNQPHRNPQRSNPQRSNPQRSNPQKNRPQHSGQKNPGGPKGPGQKNQNQQNGATPPKKGAGLGCAIVLGVFVLVIGLPVFFAGLDEGWFESSGDSDMTITTPTQQEAADLVAQLAEAEKAHGICYGWRLKDLNDHQSDEPLSQGSSRGVGVEARTCERWAQVEVDIDYASPSSSLEDSAYVRVNTSTDLDPNAPSTVDLDRMGVSTQAAIDDPAAAVGMGALAVPLLMVEAGVAEALPLPEATGAPATAISRPGSDFASNNSGSLIALGIIGGITVLCLIIGIIVRKRAGKAR